MTGSVDHILESFPNQHIARTQGEPSYGSIKQIEKLIIEHSAPIHSDLGGGNLGYLRLVASFVKFLIMPGEIGFIAYPHPPTLPQIPDGAIQPQIATTTITHKEKRLHEEQESIKKAIKN